MMNMGGMARMRRLLITVAAGLVLVLALAGCKGMTSARSGGSTSHPAHRSSHKAATDPSLTAAAPVGSGALRLLVEPAAGVGPIDTLITGARSSIDLTMYELRDTTAEGDLAAEAKRGVDVRVILDRHLEKSRNTAAYDYLSAHHVHVTWAASGTTYHQKTLTVDGRTSAIMTLNMVSEDYPSTRDFALIDTSKTILTVIAVAKHTLSVENEEMGDSTVTSALVAAARRGVDVKVVMTAESQWDSAFDELTAAGAHVHLFPNSYSALYIHAKAVVADAGRSGQQVFAGSENFSTASLRYNRELGLRTANHAVVSAISATIGTDYAHSAPYSGS